MVALSAGFAIIRVAAARRTAAERGRDRPRRAGADAGGPLRQREDRSLHPAGGHAHACAGEFIESTSLPARRCSCSLTARPFIARARASSKRCEPTSARSRAHRRSSSSCWRSTPTRHPPYRLDLSRRRRRSRRRQDLRVSRTVFRERRRGSAPRAWREVCRAQAGERAQSDAAVARGSPRTGGPSGGRIQPVPRRCESGTSAAFRPSCTTRRPAFTRRSSGLGRSSRSGTLGQKGSEVRRRSRALRRFSRLEAMKAATIDRIQELCCSVQGRKSPPESEPFSRYNRVNAETQPL